MTKFYNYINESPLRDDMTIEDINSIIQKDCKHYLNITKGKYMFKRGMFGHSDTFGLKKVRQDRRPRGMNLYPYKNLNTWLENNGHVRRDKSVIAANIKGTTSIFGNVYYIFPIGKFDYTWLMAKDINMDDGRTGWYSTAVENFIIQGEKTFNNTYGLSMKYDFKDYFTTNKDIETAWTNKYEIWFNCKEYYYFNSEYFGWSNGELIKLLYW